MPDRSKGRVRRSVVPSSWSYKLGIGSIVNDPIPEKFPVTKPWRKPRPTQGCSASKEEEEEAVEIVR
jgi:hypothetical protein